MRMKSVLASAGIFLATAGVSFGQAPYLAPGWGLQPYSGANVVPVQMVQAAPAPVAPAPSAPLDSTAVEDIVRRTVAEMNTQQTGSEPAPYRMEGGFQLVFLRPYFDGFTNGTVVQESGQFPTFDTETREPEFDLGTAMRLWLQGTGPGGFGGRVTYLQFNHGSGPETAVETVNNQPGGNESLSTGLSMRIVDMELLAQRQYGLWLLSLSGGVRYGHLVHNLNEYYLGEGQNTSSVIKVDFEGWGPTVGLQARRSIIGGLGAFVGTRASLLAGNDNSRSEFVALDTDGTILSRQSTRSRTDETLLVGEVQLGIEWARTSGTWLPFFQIGIEGQWWRDGGHVLTGDPSGGFAPNANISGNTGLDDLSLVGFFLTAGIRR